MRKFFFILASLLLSATGFSQIEPVKVTDMLKIKSIGNVNLSPDGSKAVFTVTSIESDGDSKLEYKYVTQIWMVNTDGNSSPRQLTTAKENSTQPAFGPGGNQILFVRNVDGRPQIFLLPLDGGEAFQVTRYRYGASGPKWSPDGKHILFTSSVSLNNLLKDSMLNPDKFVPAWSLEKPGFEKNQHLVQNPAKPDPDGNIEEIRAYLDNNAIDRKAKVVNRLNFQDETDINADLNFNHVFIVETKPGAEPRALTKGFYRFVAADFAPDGSFIVLTGNRDSLQHPDRSLESGVFFLNMDGSPYRKPIYSEGKNSNTPLVSPSGKWLAYQSGTTSFVGIAGLFLYSLNALTPKFNEIAFDRTKGNLRWSADDRYLYFTAQSNGGQPLYRFDINKPGAAPEQLTPYTSGIINFDITANKIVYVKTEPTNPFELYVSDLSGKNERRLSRFNDWVTTRKISLPEKRSFKNEKGMEIEYWVMKPTNYESGKKYPLLLEIHGGPSAMWGPGETSMWHEYQYFCSRGYGIVYCNPRGSGGYGLDFLRANINDWGAGPSKDVLTALDKTIAAENWVDTSKLFVTGGSYAGYLIAWILSHDQRFKAACSQRGVYDLATFFGEGNAWRLVPNYFGGYPWEEKTKATLERESPINYVQNIKTPYIIFHGDNDRRTGFVQSEMLYRSLKQLGRPVEYVRHPGGTHELTRSGNNRQRMDQLLRTYEFFERWMR